MTWACLSSKQGDLHELIFHINLFLSVQLFFSATLFQCTSLIFLKASPRFASISIQSICFNFFLFLVQAWKEEFWFPNNIQLNNFSYFSLINEFIFFCQYSWLFWTSLIHYICCSHTNLVCIVLPTFAAVTDWKDLEDLLCASLLVFDVIPWILGYTPLYHISHFSLMFLCQRCFQMSLSCVFSSKVTGLFYT